MAISTIIFSGKFDNEQQFLLDNRIYQDRVGYEVITPVKVAGLKKRVLVDRGWIESPPTRQILPVITSVFGSQIINGIIRIPLGIT